MTRILLLAAALLSPLAASAALPEAQNVSFDGGRQRPELGGERSVRTDLVYAPDREPEPKKPNPWLAPRHFYWGASGALIGGLVGSFGGLIGAGIGALIGFAIAYAISKITS